MFTGIITDIGTISKAAKQGEELRLRIRTAYEAAGIKLGESIACNGCCLTVVEKGAETDASFFDVELSAETLRCTAAFWQQGQRLNLERALKMGDDLSGHLVSGHVDGVGHIHSIKAVDDSRRLDIRFPAELAGYIAPKGSITINGISLTINEVMDGTFSVNIIPHTWAHTQLPDLREGDAVNLEVDLIARYVTQALKHRNI